MFLFLQSETGELIPTQHQLLLDAHFELPRGKNLLMHTLAMRKSFQTGNIIILFYICMILFYIILCIYDTSIVCSKNNKQWYFSINMVLCIRGKL